MKRLFSLRPAPLAALFCNILLAYVVLTLCRLAFLWVNWDLYAAEMSSSLFWSMMRGGIYFDTSTICYLNALYLLLMLLPLPAKENALYYRVVKVVFVTINSLGVVANLVDSVYFRFSGRRTTASVFREFGNEGNIAQIFAQGFLTYWYLTLGGLLLIALLWWLYRSPRPLSARPLWRYFALTALPLLALIPFVVFGIRGGMTRDIRPITLSNANNYVNRPVEAAVVLNTPFSIIRTMGHRVFVNPGYYSDPARLAALYTPLRQPADSLVERRKNVVVFIMESFGREYVGALNRDLDGGSYRGYTPFLDSLAGQSLTFEYALGNGRKSIDGMPSVLSSIPMFVEPFFLAQTSLNKVQSLATELKREGYYTAFFHGAPNGSMGFMAYSRAAGFDGYYGKDEYDADSRFGGEKDFDGYWAVWDEEFLQFYALAMSGFGQPFATSVFTATSHHPFQIPARYEGRFKGGDQPIHRCVEYSDYALRRFFETARQQPWFENTIFVIVADHTNQTTHDEYKNDYGLFRLPLIFYDPSGEMPRGLSPTLAQQIDIMPTLLNYLGYSRPYVAFGQDLLNTPADRRFAVNYSNGVYQFFKGDLLLQFDGQRPVALYNFKEDVQLKQNLLGTLPERQEAMECELKAIIQQYMERMVEDRLTADSEP